MEQAVFLLAAAFRHHHVNRQIGYFLQMRIQQMPAAEADGGKISRY